MKEKYLKERWNYLNKRYDIKEAEFTNGMIIHIDNYKIHHYCCVDKIELFFGEHYMTNAYMDDLVHIRGVKPDEEDVKKLKNMYVNIGYNIDERKYELTGRILSATNTHLNLLSSEDGEHYTIYFSEIEWIKKVD